MVKAINRLRFRIEVIYIFFLTKWIMSLFLNTKIISYRIIPLLYVKIYNLMHLNVLNFSIETHCTIILYNLTLFKTEKKIIDRKLNLFIAEFFLA